MNHGLRAPDGLATLVFDTLDASDDIVFCLEQVDEGREGIVIAASNGAFCRATGYDQSEIVGRPLSALLASQDDATYASVLASAHDRNSIRTQLLCRRADNRPFWLGVHLMPAERAGSNYLIGLGRDITDSLHERQQQRAIESLLAEVFRGVHVPVAIVTNDGLVQMTNPALDSFLGRPAGALVGQQVLDYIGPSFRAAVLAARQRQMLDGSSYTMQVSVLHSANAERIVELTSTTARRNDLKRFRILTLVPCPESAQSLSVCVAGKIKLVGLQEIRAALGPRWPEISAKALATAEHIIRQRCGQSDSYSRTPEDDFLICFGRGMSEDEAAFRAAAIAKEIRARLIGEGEDSNIGKVSAITASIEIPADARQQPDTLNKLLNDRLTAQLGAIEAKARETLRTAVANASCELEPILTRSGDEPVAYLAQISRDMDHRIQSAYCAIPAQERDAFDYDRLVLSVAAEGAVAQLAAGQASTIFVPVGFEAYLVRHCFERYLHTLRSLDQRLRERLMLMITGLPKGCPQSRLLECVSLLRPTCRGVGLQFETLEMPRIDFALLGAPVISLRIDGMRIEDPGEKARLAKLVQRLHAYNSRVLVRQTGRLDRAQLLYEAGADLTSCAAAGG